VFVAGHRGMVGSAIVRALAARGDVELVLRTHRELDLTEQQDVRHFFATERISRSTWRPRAWAASMPITPIPPSSSSRT
jgi:nucleoside-diphosphate-sugar epimerase